MSPYEIAVTEALWRLAGIQFRTGQDRRQCITVATLVGCILDRNDRKSGIMRFKSS